MTAPSLTHMEMTDADSVRFEAKVLRTDGCWWWIGSTRRGYGAFWIGGRVMRSHRVAYEASRGPIPPGLTLDHLCKNPACVNPDHLEPVTQYENVMRGDSFSAAKARQTHCIRGHEMSGDNLRLKRNGARECKECCRNRSRERRIAISAALADDGKGQP